MARPGRGPDTVCARVDPMCARALPVPCVGPPPSPGRVRRTSRPDLGAAPPRPPRGPRGGGRGQNPRARTPPDTLPAAPLAPRPMSLLARPARAGAARFLSTAGAAPLALPDLPYDYGELEPVVNNEIMSLHHKKHHQVSPPGGPGRLVGGRALLGPARARDRRGGARAANRRLR